MNDERVRGEPYILWAGVAPMEYLFTPIRPSPGFFHDSNVAWA